MSAAREVILQLIRTIQGPDRDVGSLDFRRWLQEVSPEYQWDPPHIRLIADHLDMVTAGKLRRLIISLPPRHGKSETVSVRYAAYRIEEDASCRVMLCSYAADLAQTFSRSARRIATARGIVGRELRRSAEWTTSAGGGLRAAGVDSGITGRGADLVIIDDPHRGRVEAESKAERDKVWNWYLSDVYTRLEPGAAMIIIQTRWNLDDLVGRILGSPDADSWTVLRIPALADEDDPLDRKLGEALWPRRYDKGALEAIRAIEGEYAFQALYQGNPTPREGNMFKVGRIGIVQVVPEGLRSVRAWDLAAVETGNWTVGVRIAGPDSDGLFYVVDVVRGRWEASERNARIRQTALLDGRAVTIRIPKDPGAGGTEAAQALVRFLAGFSVKPEPVSGSKELRAEPYAAQVNGGNVRVLEAPWDAAYLEELGSFSAGVHDDQVDASSDAFNELAGRKAWAKSFIA